MAEAVFFKELLHEAGFDPSRVKLLRHDKTALDIWQRGPDHFLSFVSIQSADHSPFARNPRYVAHFLPGPELPGGGFSAYFVGMTELHDRWPWDKKRFPRTWVHDYHNQGSNAEAADQSWVAGLNDKVGALIIDWGNAPRSWHQWAHQKPKPILTTTDRLPSLPEIAKSGGTTAFLGPEDRYRETLNYEERELAGIIAHDPSIIDRSFSDAKNSLATPRPEQARFRKHLIKRYNGTCCLSGCTVLEALEAAHIIPFSEGHAGRNLALNGLLLRRDLHRLFDLLLISVDPRDGTVWLAPELRVSDYSDMAGQSFDIDASPLAIAEHFRRACPSAAI